MRRQRPRPVRLCKATSNPAGSPDAAAKDCDSAVHRLLYAVWAFFLLCLFALPAAAQPPEEGTPSTNQTAETTIAKVEADLQAARQKRADGPSRPLAYLVAEGIATPEERDEWLLLMNLRIGSLEKQLDAVRNLGFEIQSREEVKAQAEAWSGFAQAPPYSIDFIDDLWAQLVARQQDMEAAQIARNLMATQTEVLRAQLTESQQTSRQAQEHASRTSGDATQDQARLKWLSELATERVQTTLATLGQYAAILKYNNETQTILKLKIDLLQRQIAQATNASPLTQEDLDSKLSANHAKRVALEHELSVAIESEQKARALVDKARVELQQRQTEAATGNADDEARIEFAQDMLEARRAQMETALLRQEALRLLLDATLGADRIWRARFEVAHDPGLQRLREMRTVLDDTGRRVKLWKEYLDNSLDAAKGLASAAEKRMAASEKDSLERTIAEAMVDASLERRTLYERMQSEIKQIELLLLRWRQEVEARDATVPRSERVKDVVQRLLEGLAAFWHLEVFAVQDTIEVDGQKVTGSSSVTVGKVATVILILTLGLWIAAQASARISGLVRNRLDMSITAAALLERGLYITAVIALLLTALDIVNIPLTVFAFLGGAIAIGVGFGAQNLINNFISGLIMLIERPISLGDLVEVEGVRGRVRNIGARCSIISRADGIDMLVPNSSFLEKNVTNLTLINSQLRVAVKVGVAYGSPLRDVTRLLKEAAASHGKVLKEPEPLILFEDFGDDALLFSVEIWVNVSPQTDSRVVASDLRYMIERLLREAGIEIAFPQRDVHLDQRRPLEVVVKPGNAESDNHAGT